LRYTDSFSPINCTPFKFVRKSIPPTKKNQTAVAHKITFGRNIGIFLPFHPRDDSNNAGEKEEI
jgi:hypothetical protein